MIAYLRSLLRKQAAQCDDVQRSPVKETIVSCNEQQAVVGTRKDGGDRPALEAFVAPEVLDLGNLSAASPMVRTVQVGTTAPAVVSSSVPWMYVEPSKLDTPGQHELRVMLDANFLTAGSILEAQVELSSGTGTSAIRVYGAVDKSWSSTSPKSAVLQQEPWSLAAKLSGHEGTVRCVAFVGETGYVVTGSEDRTLRWWNLEDGANTIVETFQCPVWSLSVSQDQRSLAVGLQNGCVILYDIAKRAKLWERQVHAGYVSSLLFWRDNGVLIASSGDKSISFTKTVSGQPAGGSLPHEGVATSAALSGNGLLLATTSQNKKVFLWDLGKRVRLRELVGHTANVWSVAFSLNGYRLASGAEDKTVCIWDAYTGQLERRFAAFQSRVFCVTISPNGRLLATASGEPKTRVWDTRSGHQLASLDSGARWISNLAFSPDGRLLAGSSYDRSIYVWRVGEVPQTT